MCQQTSLTVLISARREAALLDTADSYVSLGLALGALLHACGQAQ
jgi:hypothetical protein